MSTIQLTLFFVAFALTSLAFFVLKARPKSPVSRAFALQTTLFAGWVLGLAGIQSGHFLVWWVRLTFMCASLMPAAFLVFSRRFPSPSPPSSPLLLGILSMVGVVFSLLSLGTDWVVFDVAIDINGLSRKTGPLYPFFALYFLGAWCVGLRILARKWRSSRGLARVQLQYVGVGIVVGSVGGISTNLIVPLITGASTYTWVGPYFSLAYVGFVAHAIIRHRLMDLRLFIHRGLTIAIAIVLSAVPTAVLIAVFWPRLLTGLDGFELVLLLAAVGIVTVLIPITRDVASRLLDHYVYRTHADYQKTVREASQMLTQVLQLETLLAFISTTVMRSMAVEGVALYLREAEVFRCAIGDKQADVHHFDVPQEAPIEVVKALAETHEPILADEIARERDTDPVLNDRLNQGNWSLLLPVISKNTLIAVIVVGPKLSGDPFYQQDLDLLMTLANQAGVAIKNAQLYAAAVVTNEYLENIAATMESGVVAIDASGQVAMFNRAAEQLTGLAAAATKGRPAAILPTCLAEPLLATASDGHRRTQPEVHLPTATSATESASSRPVMCTVSPVRDPGGAALGAVAVFSDLTPLKELEVERRRAEQLAYFQALASGIAHEIKNPLVAIKTFTQLLPRRHNDVRFIEEFGQISTREIDRIQRLLDRLRTLSRPAGGPRHPLDLQLPLGDVLDLVRPTLEEKSLSLTAAFGTEPCVVLGNHAELEQLFLNLLLNAHDATPNGGTVSVEVTRTESEVTVAISDSGPGIEPDLLERVFEPFFTTKARGSGLGLAISAGIAQAHDARLRANNRDTGGAIFTVEFPVPPVVSAVVS